MLFCALCQMILGKPVARPAELDSQVAEEIYECGKECDFQPMLGGTLCTDDFYEGVKCQSHMPFFSDFIDRTSSYRWCYL